VYERYGICATEQHVVELERAQPKGGGVRCYVLVGHEDHRVLLTLSLERARRFATALRNALALLEGRLALTADGVVERSATYSMRAVPLVGDGGTGLVFVACGNPRGARLRMQLAQEELEELAAAVEDACRLAHDLSQSADRLVPDTFPPDWV
jgi:hypothetical protein